MVIKVNFQFIGDPEPAATTGVDGAVTDFILPYIGDLVQHRSREGSAVLGRVKERMYVYELGDGFDVSGSVSVTLLLEKVSVQ